MSEARRYLNTGETLVVDGGNGTVLAEPDNFLVDHFHKRQRDIKRAARELVKLTDAKSRARSGERITLLANIEIEDDLKILRKVNAAGVGLYRTEFLYMGRTDVPDEDEHYRTYMKVVRALRGAPLTIRTVDFGADKEVETVSTGPLAHNPRHGPARYSTCVSMIHRCSCRSCAPSCALQPKGPIKIMFPMLTTVTELLQAMQLVENTKDMLRSKEYRL